MTAESMRDHQKPGFARLLQDIEKKIVPGMTLAAALEIILTLDGRQALSFGIQSLTAMQLGLLETAPDLPLLALAASGMDEIAGSASEPASLLPAIWYLGIWSHGRLWLSRRRPDDAECRLLATVPVPPALCTATARCATWISDSRARCDGQVHAFFAWLDAQDVQQVLYEVHEAVDHTDPVLLYIGDELFSNFGKFNNLQERNGDLPNCFHRRAKSMSVDQWTWSEKIYVFCLYWLRVAGCRGEEFNGRQMGPALLDAYFDERIAQFQACKSPYSENASIADKARLLARCKTEQADTLLTYRWINGLNFYKEERLCPRARVPVGIESIPPKLRRYLADAYGIDAAQHASLKSLFDACVEQMAATGFASDEPSLNAVEKTLKVIVDCAIEATGSDVGMTRGTRDVARMQQAFAAERYDDICAWPAVDYFCAVFPSPAMHEKLRAKPDLLVKILYACSGRMQFNHWHYMPGHCPRDRVPADRHFYQPPRLPDIAIWSDQHHAGHVLAEVRHSIRSPTPLAFNGKTYAGMVDLRLFRQRGEAYTEEELIVALMYSEYVRVLHQSVSDRLAQGDIALCIDAFDKEWYRRYYGADQAPVAATPAHSAPDATPAAQADPGLPATELFRILCKHAAGGNGTALIEARQPYDDVSLGYASVLAHVLALRQAMQRYDLDAGARIAVLSQRPLHQTLTILAGIANGLVAYPLNPGLSPAVLQAQLQHAQPGLLIVDGSKPVPEGLPPQIHCVTWDQLFGAVSDAALPAALLQAAQATPDAAETGGLLIYTSGTTGNSKGVLLDWRHIHANVRFAIDTLDFAPGWIAGSLLPRFHTFTLISDLFPALFLGGTTVLADTFDLRNVKWTVDAFRRLGVQSYSAAPIILEALAGLDAWAQAPAMRFAVAGAAPLKEHTRLDYQQAFGHPIIPCYGLSETTCFATISQPHAIRPGAVGRPAGIDILVIDEHGMPLEPNATGELAMRGASVIRDSYFNDADGQFAAAFTADGWFKTGDIGRIDEDGYVYVTGRKKNMVIRGGEKIYLEDVDRCLADYLGVLDSASIVLCEPQMPDQALTFIVTSGAPLAIHDIGVHIRAALTAQHLPDRIYFVDRIPRTPSGKASHPELLALSKALNKGCKEPV